MACPAVGILVDAPLAMSQIIRPLRSNPSSRVNIFAPSGEKATGPLFLGTEKESEEAQALLRTYLDENLQFVVDRKKLNIEEH